MSRPGPPEASAVSRPGPPEAGAVSQSRPPEAGVGLCGAAGTDAVRVDAPAKVAGTARYAYEQPVDDPAYLHPIVSSVAKGRVTGFDTSRAESMDGVALVMTHDNAPRLRVKTSGDLWVLQSPRIRHRGQFVGAVVAATPQVARHAAEAVGVAYEEEPADLDFTPERSDFYAPRRVNGMHRGRSDHGDVDTALAAGEHVVEATYSTSAGYHNPIEPHPVVAVWHSARRGNPAATRLTLYEANQGAFPYHLSLLPPLLGLLPGQLRIVSPYVGGSFGSKLFPHPHLVLAALAAKMLKDRPIKYSLTRQQMFRTVGYRPPSHQRVRLGSDSEGRLTAVDHQSWAPNSKTRRFIEQTVNVSRMMYAAPARRTVHHAVDLDVAPATFMRAPGEHTGMFALETALDELADRLGLDPVELRIRNEPDADPETGKPFSTRNLVRCLREGAERFGWSDRSAVGGRRDGEWLIGLGVAAATYPNQHFAPSRARITFREGRYSVELQGADPGTGARTVLRQLAAEALAVPGDAVDAVIGETGLPLAMLAGGSAGTYEWGNAVAAAAAKLRRRHGAGVPEGASAAAVGFAPRRARKRSRHAFGAHFAQVRVSRATGEVRVDRMLGMYGAGRIINPRTARSQLIGGMTMGVSSALHEESYLDARFGHVVNGDLAGYHIAAHADIAAIEAAWIDEFDEWFGPSGAKGVGELGIVGVPAAVGNAIFNAAGVRLRDLPFTPDKVILELEESTVLNPP